MLPRPCISAAKSSQFTFHLLPSTSIYFQSPTTQKSLDSNRTSNPWTLDTYHNDLQWHPTATTADLPNKSIGEGKCLKFLIVSLSTHAAFFDPTGAPCGLHYLSHSHDLATEPVSGCVAGNYPVKPMVQRLQNPANKRFWLINTDFTCQQSTMCRNYYQ